MYPINEKEILELKRFCLQYKNSYESMCKSYTFEADEAFTHAGKKIGNRVDLILFLIEEWAKEK